MLSLLFLRAATPVSPDWGYPVSREEGGAQLLKWKGKVFVLFKEPVCELENMC